MSEILKIGEIEVEENMKRSGTLKVAGRSLSPIEVPITIVRGSSSGSTLCVLAGEHGCEYAGIEACVRLSKTISPKELSGTLIIIPVVNVPGFENRTPYVCPIDNVDLSSAWPGKQIVSHSISHIITHTIFHQVIRKSNYIITLHGGDLVESLSDPCILLHKTGNKKVDEASENMAKNFGIEYVVEYKEEKGGLTREATERGIPTILPEAGGEGKVEESDVSILYEGVLNVMKCLGMIKGEPLIKVKPRIIRRSAHVFTEKEGLFYSHVKVGDMVLEGEVIGEIKNISGETVYELKAPIKGKVFFKLNSLSWDPSLGWFLYMIADVDDYYY